MAITDINLSGKVRADDGDAVAGATVTIHHTAADLGGTQEASYDAGTGTDSNGTWTFTETSLDATYDVKIAKGNSKRYIAWSDEITLKTVDTSALKVRGVEGADAPIYLFADQADENIDVWRINAADGGALTFDNRASGSADSDLVAQMTITPAASVASSMVTVPGILNIDGAVDFDGTDVDIVSSGDIDLVSSYNAAAAIHLHQSTGTSGTIKIHADTGTSATEGAASIQLLSDDGGINIKSGLNGANAILLTADGGTSETIVIHSDLGTGTGSIELLSDVGGIEIDAGTDIILDAGGADIFLKDDGTLFGTLTNSSGELLIKSSSSGTTAATFSGANVTFAGTVDATTDFTIGSTVITDDSIVMTPSASDTVTVAAATNGVLNITTVDNAAHAANLAITVDGSVTIDAVDNIELDSATGIWVFEDDGTEVLRFTEGNTGDVTVKLAVNGKDLVFTDNGDATNMKILDAAAGINVPGEVQTTGIAYTDGDNAMTIADGGGVTFPVSIDITGSAGIILENDETITNSTNGLISLSGNLAIPNGGTIGVADDTDSITISSGGVVTMDQIPVFSAGINVSGGTIAGTLATASQANVTTLAGLTTAGAVANALALTYSDITFFHDANNADTSFTMGTSATEALKIEVLNGGSNKTAEAVHFSTATASATADHGAMVFDVDGTDILTIDDGGLVIKTTGTIGPVGDEDLVTLTASGSIVAVAGELSVTTLDIGGTDVTSTAAELNILDTVTATATELNYLDITTLGTSEASKAVTVDSSGDLLVPDSDKYKFGAGSDMQLYHDGSNSYITNATGALKLATETSGIAVTIGHTTSEVTVADNLAVTGTLTIGADTVLSRGAANRIDLASGDSLRVSSSGSFDVAASGKLYQTGGEPQLESSSTGGAESQLHIVGKHPAGSLFLDSERISSSAGTAIQIRTLNAADPNAATDRITITGGVTTAVVTVASSSLVLGSPTGGAKGAGTINAVEIYDDNSQLTDWVFEEYYGKGMELTRS